MDGITFIRHQVFNLRGYIDTVLGNITDEQFNWIPPGTVSPISAIFIHLLMAEDYFIQTVLQGKSPYWVEDHWSQKVGVDYPPQQGGSWDHFKNIKVSMAPVLAYQGSVRAATDTYLADLTAEKLEQQVTFAGNQLPASEVLMTMVVHGASHAGEISAIKGMQGFEGLPY